MKRIKWWFQKRIRGYSDNDLWNLDHFLAKFLHKVMSSYIAAKRISYPGIIPGKTEEESIQEWEDTLQTMKEGFKAAIEVCEDNYLPDFVTGYGDKEMMRTDGSTFIIHDYPITDFDGYNKKTAKLRDKAQQALKLLAERFFELWD
jgi:hypothetical protein